MYIVGLDISTIKSGIVVLDKKTKALNEYQLIKMKSLNKYKNRIEYIKELERKLKIVFDKYNGLIDCVIIEQNLKMYQLVQAVSYWVVLLRDYGIKEMRTIESSKWYALLKLGDRRDKREVRKAKSLKFFKEKTKINENISDDISDAYCIALSYWK